MITIETYYLIDYENVGSDGLEGCSDLTKTDHIIIFFTKNAKKIDMSEIADHGESVLRMVEVPAGKQSTDIHIGSYLGYLAGKNEKKECKVIIVSKDTDYDKVIRFWAQKTGIKAARTQRINTQKTTQKQEKTQKKEKGAKKETPKGSVKSKQFSKEIIKAVRDASFDASVANTVSQIAAKHYEDENMPTEVHNALRERYTDYLDVYAAVRPVLIRKAAAQRAKEKEKLKKIGKKGD